MIVYEEDHIIDCRPLSSYRVWLKFEDGLTGTVDLSHLKGRGVFQSWESLDFFRSVHVNPESKTIEWGDSIDLDPGVLREEIILNYAKNHQKRRADS